MQRFNEYSLHRTLVSFFGTFLSPSLSPFFGTFLGTLLTPLLAPLLGILLVLSVTACSNTNTKKPSVSDDSFQSLPPGYSTERTGNLNDFDFFKGAWITQQHRLVERGVGSQDWEDYPAYLCMTPYLDGMVAVEELYVPSKRLAGLSIRAFNPEDEQWSIYWLSSAHGELEGPVVGGFKDNHGEFYGVGVDAGRPVKVRFVMEKIDRNHARWEQAYSYDNQNWETNWTADFLRAEARVACENGRPKQAVNLE